MVKKKEPDGEIVEADDIWDLTDEEMASITFSGEPSCRLGYRYLLASILYSVANTQLVDDPYDIPGFGGDYRILAEMAFIIGVYEDDKNTIEIMKTETEGVAKLPKRGLKGEVKELWDLHHSLKGKIDYMGLLDALKLKHLLIGDRLFAGTSGNLNDVLEVFASTVCEKALQQGIPLIASPRESFIMPAKDKSTIHELMKAYYKENFLFDVEVDELIPGK